MTNARTKVRIDQLLVERGLAPSREKAQALIMAGVVLVEDSPAEKAGERFYQDCAIRLRGEVLRFVGRGGDKIDPAFTHFNVALEGVTALDVGASTGGFTDCMLQRGAIRVYAVDVGYNQLDQKLRQDPRVVVMERTHAKELRPDCFEPRPSFFTMDVSFISVRKVLPYVIPCLAPAASGLVLIKPQFELEPEFVEKGGVVRDERHQRLAIDLVSQFIADAGLLSAGVFASPLRGEKAGNQEYFIQLGVPQ